MTILSSLVWSAVDDPSNFHFSSLLDLIIRSLWFQLVDPIPLYVFKKVCYNPDIFSTDFFSFVLNEFFHQQI